MSLHLQRFVDRVQSNENRGARDLVISMHDARAMHAELTRLLLELTELRAAAAKPQQPEVITVEVQGPSF